MLNWTYWRETEIEVTDGRQRMHLSLSIIPQLATWFVRDTYRTFVSYQNYMAIDTDDSAHLIWHGMSNMPVVGLVRKTVRWPREEVQQLVRAVLVAERLRVRSEPHKMYFTDTIGKELL